MTATYREIGRRIVEYEQSGGQRAEYGKELINRLSMDLTRRFGRGFGPVNLSQMRKFYLFWSPLQIFQTVSEKSGDIPQTVSAKYPEKIQTPSGKSQTEILQSLSAKFTPGDIAKCFPLPWSHYVLLLSIKKSEARAFEGAGIKSILFHIASLIPEFTFSVFQFGLRTPSH